MVRLFNNVISAKMAESKNSTNTQPADIVAVNACRGVGGRGNSTLAPDNRLSIFLHTAPKSPVF